MKQERLRLLLPDHRHKTGRWLSRMALKGGIFAVAMLLCFAVQSYAQSTIYRSTTIIVGASPFQDSLWTVDTTDYSIVSRIAPTMAGFTVTGINGLATHPFTGVHYAILKLSGVSGRVLATIDISTGVATMVGNLGDNFSSITFNANGTLFGVTGDGATVPETMYRINTADASKTLFRTLGAGADGEVILYNWDNNYFYHWSGNGTVVWERFDTTGVDVIETLTYTGTPGGETFGAGYLGGGRMLVSDINSNLRVWDTLGNIGASLVAMPDDVRGLLLETCPSAVNADGPLTFCAGDSVRFTVTGGTGGYQWYMNGGPVAGATTANYTATATGYYNVIFTDSCGVTDSLTTGFPVMVYPTPAIMLPANTSVCPGATVAFLPFSATTTFGFTGGEQTYVVPAGVTSLSFDVVGAAGGQENRSGATSPAGFGGRVQGTLNVTPGQQLNVFVGGIGGTGTAAGAAGGYNGGGAANAFGGFSGGGGGGASDIRIGGTALWQRAVIAGGGGGNGWDSPPGVLPGGDGGDLTGAASATNPSAGATPALGGDQAVGGLAATYPPFWVPGGTGTYGAGGDGSASGVSGGGGGGYYGGGGGVYSGGGGGSSYTDPAYVPAGSVSHTQGYNNGSGFVTITYSLTGTYNIVWSGAAATAGFTNVTAAAIPSSPLSIAVPAGAAPGIYNGVINFNDGSCNSVDYAFSVIVNDTPVVDTPDNVIVCNGEATTAIAFTSPESGTTFTWTNDNTAIGLSASGSGDIASFTATNTGTDPDTAVIMVTPLANGCTGDAVPFLIVVNPTPALSTSLTAAICDSSEFAYTQVSLTAGTTFTWSRAAVTGVSNAAASGTGNISEYLNNTTTDPVEVIYIDTLRANGCMNTQAITVTVNPTPVLTSPLSNGPICDSTTFTYVSTSATAGTTFSWSRAAVTGISNPAASGTGVISEMLVNTTAVPVEVTYIDTLTFNGCSNTQSVTVTVNPTPRLSTSDSAFACDSLLFHYVPGSATPGTTFTWSRDAIAGISNASASGVDSIDEVLYNITDTQVVVTYTLTLTANGCPPSTQLLTVIVNPTLRLSSTLTPAAICGGTMFSYTPVSPTPGVTFSWTRPAVFGISNPTASGTGNPSEILLDTTAAKVGVTYIFTLSLGGCSNVYYVTDTVKPRPRLTSTLTPPAICDSTLFAYTPSFSVAGTTATWVRPFVSGILSLGSSGTGAISEVLHNTTNGNRDVIYTYTMTADGCTNSQDVTVTVRPQPELTSALSHTICSGSTFNYTPATLLTIPVTMTWARVAIAGILPATGATGSGSISETLTNTTSAPITVTYIYGLTVAGTCTRSQAVTVTVNPAGTPPAITTKSPATLCAQTMYQNFGASVAPPSGVTYTWSASNAVIHATGSNDQYILVNFTNPGTAVVRLSSSVGTGGCAGTDSFVVTVGATTAHMPVVIYTSGQFIALDNEVDSYQWGYDDRTTLDSVIIPGATGQIYMPTSVDLANRYYWVMTVRNGCMQKSYYNLPTAVGETQNGYADVRVFPNPAGEYVNVEVSKSVTGSITVEMQNMLGQEISTTAAINNAARLDVAGLPAGVYMVNCYNNGVKIASARFVKN